MAIILAHMKITVNIDDKLVARASELTGVREKTALVRMGLDALIARASAARLASLGGTEKQLKPILSRRERMAVIQRAAGTWKDRTDLPDFRKMRGE